MGYAYQQDELPKIVRKVTAIGFIERKAQRNRELIEEIKNFAFTKSSSPEFDLYCAQTFLDNVLRGGLPVTLNTGEGKVAFNVYSRKHGDLERDYNHFVLTPTYFSQGNGNYRDVNQNRRNDVWFNRDVADSTIINFISLLQADGYNPLLVKGMSFSVEEVEKVDSIIQECIQNNGNLQLLKDRLQSIFQPGELLNFIEQKNFKLKVSTREFLRKIL